MTDDTIIPAAGHDLGIPGAVAPHTAAADEHG
jgi:hypothetical protein